MAYQTVKVRRQLLEDFKAACAARGDRVNTVLREAMENYVTIGVKRTRKPMTPEQRNAYNAYQRNYRHANQDKVRKWQNDYIMRKAARLMKEE